jgi:hypothetical protein
MLCVKKDFERHIDACEIDCSSDPILLNQTDLLRISTSVTQDCHTTIWHPYTERERETVYYGPFHIQVQTAIMHIPSSNKHMRETDFYHQHHDYDHLCRYAFPHSCWLWSSNPTQTQMPASLLIANFKKLHYHPHHPITPGECGTGLWLHSP